MATSEFCLKWNDFQQNVSKTFSQLRQQSDLFDVTLVSSDQKQVSAHRLVLSACSEFFKNIFCSNTRSHPLLYLDGVNLAEVNLMLDYVYYGEVKVYQEYLDRFLEVANKFKLDGLLATETDVTSPQDPFVEDSKELRADIETVQEQKDFLHSSNIQVRTVNVMNQSIKANNSEIESKFEELIIRENNIWRCTVCQQISNSKFNIKRHLEIHLSGLSYDCHKCGKNFRSSKALENHTYRKQCLQ